MHSFWKGFLLSVVMMRALTFASISEAPLTQTVQTAQPLSSALVRQISEAALLANGASRGTFFIPTGVSISEVSRHLPGFSAPPLFLQEAITTSNSKDPFSQVTFQTSQDQMHPEFGYGFSNRMTLNNLVQQAYEQTFHGWVSAPNSEPVSISAGR